MVRSDRSTRERKGANLITIYNPNIMAGKVGAKNFYKALSLFLTFLGFYFVYLNAAEGANFCVSTPQQLQNALATAASNSEDDVINIVQGVYHGSFIYTSTEEYNLTIRGGFGVGCASRIADPTNTVLDAESSGSVLVLSATFPYVDLSVDALTLRNGAVSNKPGGGLYMFSDWGNCTLSNSLISNNSSDYGVGGLYMDCSPTARVTDCSFENNHSNGYSLESAGGAKVNANKVLVSNSHFINNTAKGNGGGLYLTGGYPSEIIHNAFVSNTASNGGGALLFCTGTVASNIFIGNTATNYGGGVYAAGPTLANNIIHGNSAFRGAGIYIGQPKILNNTITSNSATSTDSQCSGGGLFYIGYEGIGSGDIYNNIFWGNTSRKGSDICLLNDQGHGYLPSKINLYNNDFDQSATGIYMDLPFPIDPSNLNAVDPMFVDPGNGDFRLQTISPCIDAGNNFIPTLPATDIDGNPRIVSDRVDMGAFEYQGSSEYTLTVSVSPSAARGSVAKIPDKPIYNYRDVVTLIPIANPGYSFLGWSGDFIGTDNPDAITLTGSKAVVAHFRESTKVDVLTPNGGELIPTGSGYTIRWGAPPKAVKFNLFYSLNNGLTWKLIAQDFTDTSYYWEVPRLDISAKACRVKVVGYDDAGRQLGVSKSDKPFTIKVVRLIWPKREDLLVSGSDYTIVWENNEPKTGVSGVKLFYTKNGFNWIRIDTSSVVGNPGRFVWRVPLVRAPYTKCKIRVVLNNGARNLDNDVTDGYFTILPAP